MVDSLIKLSAAVVYNYRLPQHELPDVLKNYVSGNCYHCHNYVYSGNKIDRYMSCEKCSMSDKKCFYCLCPTTYTSACLYHIVCRGCELSTSYCGKCGTLTLGKCCEENYCLKHTTCGTCSPKCKYCVDCHDCQVPLYNCKWCLRSVCDNCVIHCVVCETQYLCYDCEEINGDNELLCASCL
nr:MAG: histone-lysine N-methyltransferase 2C-like protein [Diabrotica toursvirus 3a]